MTIGVIALCVAGALTRGTMEPWCNSGFSITVVVSATVGVGGVGTHHFASKYAKSEAEFRRNRGDSHSLAFCI